VAGAVVLDIARGQQWIGSARQKSRVGWKRGVSGETWFLLDTKVGIRVAVDKAKHVASETVASVGLRRWRMAEGGAAAWLHMASAVTRQRRARLSGG
jgi:hypothetical protein